jgi:glycosyltransferase involved in cell wall biosynthesis
LNNSLNNNYLYNQKYLNLSFNNNLSNKIKIGIYAYSIKNGGRARITALLINNLNKIKIFEIFLFTKVMKEKNEYIIPENIKRTVIKNNLLIFLKKYKINCLIYELDDINEIKFLANINNIKVIFLHHSSNFDWIYGNFTIFKVIYKFFESAKYFVSIVPFENNYLFKKWGIKSIYINDFITFNYSSIIPSKLLKNNILLIGRGYAKKKRFYIGIQAMEYIIKEITDCELYIISKLEGINNLINLVDNLNLKDKIKFIGYSSILEIYFKNSSLNLFPSISESFGMVLCETKIYGIPNILIGLDYLSISKGGTIIIYDDSSESLARESIKLLKNFQIKNFYGKEARKNIKKFKNEIILNKWLKLIFSVFNGDIYYEKLRIKNTFYEEENINILNNQIKLLKSRIQNFANLTINEYENITFMKNIY